MGQWVFKIAELLYIVSLFLVFYCDSRHRAGVVARWGYSGADWMEEFRRNLITDNPAKFKLNSLVKYEL